MGLVPSAVCDRFFLLLSVGKRGSGYQGRVWAVSDRCGGYRFPNHAGWRTVYDRGRDGDPVRIGACTQVSAAEEGVGSEYPASGGGPDHRTVLFLFHGAGQHFGRARDDHQCVRQFSGDFTRDRAVPAGENVAAQARGLCSGSCRNSADPGRRRGHF